MMCNDYGRKERILLLDKLFRFDDEFVFYYANLVCVGHCAIT